MSLLPLEKWLEACSGNADFFPCRRTDYFDRYRIIKNYLRSDVYPYIGAATSAEDQGIYTDHSEAHFDAVIRYAGLLLKVPSDPTEGNEVCISPYETFVLLVSILLHDAGNINGRRGHEKHPSAIYRNMGVAVCPDQFEANKIGAIARAHGGKRALDGGGTTKDTIGGNQLKESEEFGGIPIRQQLLAAVVRFADEICEDRSRSARFLIDQNSLPQWSEAYHHYANGISSVSVDHEGKCIKLSFELEKDSLLTTYGKGSSGAVEHVYLMDEIFSRLEKMFCELSYCRRFMSEFIKISKIRASVKIYDSDMELIKEKTFDLKEEGYPSSMIVLGELHSDWCGDALKDELQSA